MMIDFKADFLYNNFRSFLENQGEIIGSSAFISIYLFYND